MSNKNKDMDLDTVGDNTTDLNLDTSEYSVSPEDLENFDKNEEKNKNNGKDSGKSSLSPEEKKAKNKKQNIYTIGFVVLASVGYFGWTSLTEPAAVPPLPKKPVAAAVQEQTKPAVEEVKEEVKSNDSLVDSFNSNSAPQVTEVVTTIETTQPSVEPIDNQPQFNAQVQQPIDFNSPSIQVNPNMMNNGQPVHPNMMNNGQPVHPNMMNNGQPVHPNMMNNGQPVHPNMMNNGQPVHPITYDGQPVHTMNVDPSANVNVQPQAQPLNIDPNVNVQPQVQPLNFDVNVQETVVDPNQNINTNVSVVDSALAVETNAQPFVNNNSNDALLNNIKSYFDSKFDTVIDKQNKQGEEVKEIKISIDTINERLKALEEGKVDKKKVDTTKSNPVAKKTSSASTSTASKNTVVKKTTTVKKSTPKVENGERVIAYKPAPAEAAALELEEKKKVAEKEVAKKGVSSYKVHALHNGKVWIDNGNNTHKSYIVGDKLPRGEVIQSINMETETIVTSKGSFKAR